MIQISLDSLQQILNDALLVLTFNDMLRQVILLFPQNGQLFLLSGQEIALLGQLLYSILIHSLLLSEFGDALL